MKANGAVLWQGASLLDGAPLVVIATGLASGSTNRKTGDMVQTYILRADIEPTSAVRTGADRSICGDCGHRGKPAAVALGAVSMKERTCYVNIGQGPLAVYRTWLRGRYAGLQLDIARHGRGRRVRLGTYGDPAAVPTHVWRELLSQSIGHTGYTHQWRTAPTLRDLCMASVDNADDMIAARELGWRTFRVSGLSGEKDSRPLGLESLCPASAQAGKKLTCAQCLACCGADGRRGSIYIPAHGGFAVMAVINRRQAI